jgi:hypothetical protein
MKLLRPGGPDLLLLKSPGVVGGPGTPGGAVSFHHAKKLPQSPFASLPVEFLERLRVIPPDQLECEVVVDAG